MKKAGVGAKAVLLTFCSKVGFFVLMLIVGVIVARWLGPECKGIYTLIILVASLTVSIGSFNLGESAIFFYNRRDIEFNLIIGSHYLFIFLITSLYISILVFLWTLDLLPWKEISSKSHLTALAILIFLIFINLHTSDLLRCRKQFTQYNMLLILQPLVYGFSVLLFVVIFNLGLNGAIVSSIISCLIVTIFGVTIIFQGVLSKPRFDSMYLKSALTYGLKGHIGNIFQKLNLRLDQFFITPFWGAAALGNYSIAVAFSELIWYVPDSMGISNLTRIAESDKDEAIRIVQKSARINALITIVLTFCFCLLSRPIILFLYGTPYKEAVPAVYWLLPGIWCMGFSKVLSKYFSGIGRPEINTLTAFTSSVVTVTLCLLLIPQYGIIGAAFSSSLAYALRAILDMSIFLKITETELRCILIPTINDARSLYHVFMHH